MYTLYKNETPIKKFADFTEVITYLYKIKKYDFEVIFRNKKDNKPYINIGKFEYELCCDDNYYIE